MLSSSPERFGRSALGRGCRHLSCVDQRHLYMEKEEVIHQEGKVAGPASLLLSRCHAGQMLFSQDIIRAPCLFTHETAHKPTGKQGECGHIGCLQLC